MKKASYKDSQIASDIIITNLSFITSVGRGNYNLFMTDSGKVLVIFKDQKELLSYVKKNIDEIFLIKLLIPTNNKYKYVVSTPYYDYNAYTVAVASTMWDSKELVQSGDKQSRIIKTKGGNIVIRTEER